MPRQFMNRGDKLAFSNGIIGLAAVAIVVVVIFNASVTRMIPLYAVGVFVSFTLSQTGMVVHWLRLKSPGWKRRAYMNGVGAVATAIVAVMQLFTKFTEGAYIVIIAGVDPGPHLFVHPEALRDGGPFPRTPERRAAGASRSARLLAAQDDGGAVRGPGQRADGPVIGAG